MVSMNGKPLALTRAEVSPMNTPFGPGPETDAVFGILMILLFAESSPEHDAGLVSFLNGI